VTRLAICRLFAVLTIPACSDTQPRDRADPYPRSPAAVLADPAPQSVPLLRRPAELLAALRASGPEPAVSHHTAALSATDLWREAGRQDRRALIALIDTLEMLAISDPVVERRPWIVSALALGLNGDAVAQQLVTRRLIALRHRLPDSVSRAILIGRLLRASRTNAAARAEVMAILREPSPENIRGDAEILVALAGQDPALRDLLPVLAQDSADIVDEEALHLLRMFLRPDSPGRR
jgi:hypothetical protein